MGKLSYSSQEEVLKVAQRLRKEKYPLDVIHVDTDWFKEEWMCDWKFGETNFPDPKLMCVKLKEMGFKLCLWQTPYIVKSVKEYKESKKKKKARSKQILLQIFLFLIQIGLRTKLSMKTHISWQKDLIL